MENTEMKELDWKASDLINDSVERKFPIRKDRYSRWHLGRSGGLNDDHVLWIAERLGIRVSVNFGSPTIENGKIKYVIQRYNELESLIRLNKIFPQKK